MKAILNVVALCAVIALVGCNNSNKVSPGAVGDEGCCSSKSKTSCTEKSDTSMGAVSEQKSGCSKSCTGAKSDASMGAVSETKSCPASKSSCTGAKTSG